MIPALLLTSSATVLRPVTDTGLFHRYLDADGRLVECGTLWVRSDGVRLYAPPGYCVHAIEWRGEGADYRSAALREAIKFCRLHWCEPACLLEIRDGPGPASMTAFFAVALVDIVRARLGQQTHG